MHSSMETRSAKTLVKPALVMAIFLVVVGFLAVSHYSSPDSPVQREEMIQGVQSAQAACIKHLSEIARRSPRDLSAFPLSRDFMYHVSSNTATRHLRAEEARSESKGFLQNVNSVHKFIPVENVGVLFVYPDNTVISANDMCEISSAYAPVKGGLHPLIRGDVHRRMHVAQDSPGPSPTLRPTRRPTTTREPTPAENTPPPQPETTQSGSCTNIRRDWLDITQAERNLYIEGFRALRNNGRLSAFQRAHQEAGVGTDSWTAHGNQYFLPWHRYFLLELERQIRALGGKFSCFNLPYWDWTRRSGQPIGNNPMFSDAQGIGGNGDSSNGYCVADGQFSQASGYRDSRGACLRRQFSSSTIPNIQTTLNDIENNAALLGFTRLCEGRGHNNAHMGVGGRRGQIGSVPTATDDPTFWLLHCFVDLQYALWTDCHDYEQVNEPYPSNMFPDPETVLRYPVLSNENWALAQSRTFRAKDLVKTSQWNYKYDSSDMLSRSGLDLGGCDITVHTGRGVAANEVIKQGDIAARVNKEIRDMAKADTKITDVERTRRACVRGDEVAKKWGLKNQRCKYTEPIEKCGPGAEPLEISLAALLAKKGVAGNACLINVRQRLYPLMSSLRTLRLLCNGDADPVCESDHPF